MTNTYVRTTPLAAPRKDRAAEARRVANALEQMCENLTPGDRLPTHTVLMTQIGASERVVLRALDDLFRAGRIIRRPKAGTFVAERQPTVSAPQSVAQATSRTIVAITRPDHAFFSRSVELLFKLGKAAGYSVMFQPADDDTEIVLPAHGTPYTPAGYIVIGSARVELAAKIARAGYRAVAIGEAKPGQQVEAPCVHVDNSEGGYLCAEHLIALGHRRLAIADVGRDFVELPRWEGHQRAVAEAAAEGIVASTTIIDGDQVKEWAANPGLARAYFARADAPTALCTWNDTTAMALMALLQREGVRVPDDVSVMGYDNLPQGATHMPSLTTIDTNVTLQLRTAIRLLTQETPPSPITTVMLSPTLVARESTHAL